MDMPLTAKIDDLTIVKSWVDVAYTGNMISMGKGALYARSMGQKLNTTRVKYDKHDQIRNGWRQ